ncbi:MAG TPA: DNA polymerase III subunit beta, partial [Oceanicaulis sp.]|nr:DNA polymerase III subunit beta [Oceanicaulis sp.]
MKLTIERAILLKALGHVQAVVERRNTIPILSNVLINASDGFARFTATDLDMEIVEEAEASVEREGLITAPAHTLYEIARKLPEGSQVTLELGGDDPRILLSAGRSRFNLPILPPGDFPVMPSEDLAVSFTAPASEIARLIDKTKFAISTEETRYYLNGIHLHAAERDGRKTLRAVATDGHRLALAETDLPDGAMGMPAVIVPRKPIQELRRLLEDLDGDVDVSVSEGKIRFQLGAAVLTSKLIDGTFPD